MELLGQTVGVLIIAWLVLPLILWLVQGILILLVVFCAIADWLSGVCSYLEGVRNTQPSFNGYIPKDRNLINKISISNRDDNIPII